MIRCPRKRELLYTRFTGMAVLAAIALLLALSACITCPAGTPGCPQFDFIGEPRQ